MVTVTTLGGVEVTTGVGDDEGEEFEAPCSCAKTLAGTAEGAFAAVPAEPALATPGTATCVGVEATPSG